jgi:acyl-CoA thioester hydrolase
MARPQKWQLSPDSYPFSHLTETRFADMDLLGHINNVAMAGLFEHGRGMFNHSIKAQRRAEGQRWLIAAVDINYVAEAHFPEGIAIASGISRIGNSSWDIASAAFQGGECKATCITTIVLTEKTGAVPITAELRAEFERLSVSKYLRENTKPKPSSS